MVKRKEGGRRANLVRCYLSDEEYLKLCSISQELNIKLSELVRREIIYGGVLELNPAKLLMLFAQIGTDLGQIRSELGHIAKVVEDFAGNGSVEGWPTRLESCMMDYDGSRRSLEDAIRKLLIRMDKKGKPV